MTRENTNTVINRLIEDAMYIPKWVDKKNTLHINIFNTISDLITELTYIANPKFLSWKSIRQFNIDFTDIESNIENLKDLTLYIDSKNYLTEIIDKYIDIALDLEEFEILQNFVRFKQIRYNEGTNNNLLTD